MKKRFVSVCAAAVMAMSLCAGAFAADEVITCTGSADGIGGAVTVEVEATATEIISITVTEQNETDGIGSVACEELPAQIVEAQSLSIDAMSGATITSDAIVAAVKAALESADIDVAQFMDAEAETEA